MLPALRWLANWMRDRHGLGVTVEADGVGTVAASEEVALLLFRSARELLFNTVKHAGVGAARLRICQSGQDVEIEVSDKGSGLASPAGGWSSKEGGFGLSSIRERVGLLGGQMEIDSAPGCGCRIRLRVPSGAPDPQEVNAPAVPTGTSVSGMPVRGAREGRGRVRVLVVDDHAVARRGLISLLEGAADLEVVGEAADGPTAVELTARLQPDVVTIDVSMPGMDGIEATRLIRERRPGVRVVGLSMFTEGERAAAMRQAGATAYVSKCQSADGILRAIRLAATAEPKVPPGRDSRPRHRAARDKRSRGRGKSPRF